MPRSYLDLTQILIFVFNFGLKLIFLHSVKYIKIWTESRITEHGCQIDQRYCRTMSYILQMTSFQSAFRNPCSLFMLNLEVIITSLFRLLPWHDELRLSYVETQQHRSIPSQFTASVFAHGRGRSILDGRNGVYSGWIWEYSGDAALCW